MCDNYKIVLTVLNVFFYTLIYTVCWLHVMQREAQVQTKP